MIRRIPLFPLPGVVLLPGAFLPLHIFEPRYRAMVADALLDEKTIGMAMLKPGSEQAGTTAPEIFPIGGAGRIIASESLSDGRYDIVLEGVFRYRVLEESPPSPYRIARVEEIQSIPFPTHAEARRVSEEAISLFSEISGALSLPPLPEETLSPERLGSELALRLRFEPSELQELLETDSLATRLDALIKRMQEWQGRIRLLSPFRRPGLDPSKN
ncbi:MAG TPA: LON peptidase substrate-binding domain-containing protein [Thermoanaerobaculia bacterium]|nr:LON peptidase substrate-binding domain-containing protein [Thermoanaerobaculia bacterium]